MHKLMLSAVAIAFAATLVPAQADMGHGPTQNGTQCFKPSIGWSKDLIGYWGACPQPASATVTPKQRPRRNAAR
jgi:hypothetical protein